jgi:hypothetical protein
MYYYFSRKDLGGIDPIIFEQELHILNQRHKNKNKMQNTIIIKVDSEAETQITFSKPSDIKQPSNAEEAKTIILNDIVCLNGALKTLILLANDNSYGDKELLVKDSIKQLEELLTK